MGEMNLFFQIIIIGVSLFGLFSINQQNIIEFIFKMIVNDLNQNVVHFSETETVFYDEIYEINQKGEIVNSDDCDYKLCLKIPKYIFYKNENKSIITELKIDIYDRNDYLINELKYDANVLAIKEENNKKYLYFVGAKFIDLDKNKEIEFKYKNKFLIEEQKQKGGKNETN